eukprot:TRINITY_DN515_c0_g2_i2.p1 TRINITY_DN515_c0_g2~~TRINITY_DN515_c0_g2_i2.p1  ORF type:complete len:571 (-),score=89.77 TRINITY_DN515_c0_g2_i2:135-1847(-)
MKTNLVCKIETRFMKVGDKELVKTDASAVSTPSTPIVAIGGEKFALKQANDVTETNVSMSDDEYDKDDFPDEDDSEEDLPPPKNRASTVSTPAKKPESKKEPVEDRSREIAQLQQELDDLKRDKLRSEKKAERLQKELGEAKEEIEELKSQLSESSRSSTSTNQPTKLNSKSEGVDPSELEDLKRDKSRLEKKLQKLQSELEEEKKTNQQLLQAAKESEGRKSTEEPNGKARPRLSTFAVNAATPARTSGPTNNSSNNFDGGNSNNSDLSEKLEKASATTEEIMDTILKHIHKNTISNTSAEIEESTHWLAFSVTLFKVLRNGTLSIQIDKKSLKKPIRSKDLAQLDSLTRFLHNVKNLTYEVYCALLHNVYNQLETSLQLYLDGLSKGKQDQFELPPVLNETFRSLKVEGVSGFVSGHIITQIFRHIDSQLFNMLLKKTNIFKTGFGFKLKMLISRLEMATSKSIKANLNTTYQSGEHLHFIKEAANLLVMDKNMMSDSDVRSQMFTHLNPVQIAYFLKYFEPDEDAPDPVPNSVKRAVDEDAKKQGNNSTMQMDSFHIENVNLVGNLL